MISKRLFGYSMLECTEDHKFSLFDFSSCFPFCFDCYEPRVRARVCVRGAGDGDVLVLPSGEVQEVQDTQKIEDFEYFECNFHKITCTVDFRILAHQAVASTGTAVSVEHVGLQTCHIPKMFVPPVLGFDF